MAFLCPVRIRRGKKKKRECCFIDFMEKKFVPLVTYCGYSYINRPYSSDFLFILASGADVDKDLMKGASGLTPGMGRITGSASIETLVRVGIEKEHGLSPDSKMVVLYDFTPCVDDELEVKRGQVLCELIYN